MKILFQASGWVGHSKWASWPQQVGGALLMHMYILCRSLSSRVQHVYLLVDLQCRNESFMG